MECTILIDDLTVKMIFPVAEPGFPEEGCQQQRWGANPSFWLQGKTTKTTGNDNIWTARPWRPLDFTSIFHQQIEMKRLR